jgi:membrane protease YdiL (CAAX protease family)
MSVPEVLPPAPPSPPPAASNPVFRGPNGIRAGWRALIFLAIIGGLIAVAATVIAVAVHFLKIGAGRIGASSLTPVGMGLTEAVIFFLPAVAALAMSRTEHRKWGEYGLPAKFAFRENFWIGALVGFLAISATLLAIYLGHGFRLTGLATHGKTLIVSTAAWGAAFIMVGLAEEFAFRGYLQFTLTTGMGFWPAAILLSALFGLAHSANPGETKPGLLSVVCFGLLFCLFLRRTGDLWWAVGFHAGWDWGQTFFYGVPDSGLAPYHSLFNPAFDGPRWLTGGSVGPEASGFTPVVLLIVAVFFSRAYRENRYHPLGG